MVSTFTFLFTDLEGSARLWEQHPQEMRAALARHDTLLRQVVEGQSGQVVKSTGDGLMAVFSSAREGVQAALEAQCSLQDEPWGETGPLKVRMALHSGEAQVRSGDYFGPVVNRAARLMAAAHGGQILLSATVAGLLGDWLPEGAGLRDLGEHRLKDLERPERVFQLLFPGLPVNFPALNSLDLFPNNLPVQLTGFVGREKELAEVQRQLETARLITLTGPGGTGKSRLSLQAAAAALDRFPQGIWLAELAPLTDPQMVVQIVASILSVRQSPGRTYQEALVDYLRYKSLLLVLDNCEHLIDACARLADDLLRACPRLKILASSRESLGISGEVVFRVPSLSLPPAPEKTGRQPIEDLEQSEAARLFVERAQAVVPTFCLEENNAASVVQICRRLDGIPLAIELAAARVKVLSPVQIAARLDDRFRLLTGGSRTALPRQQTLKAMIDWSWELLSDSEKILLRRLSTFAGGFTLESAEAVCAGHELSSLGLTPFPRDEVLDTFASLVNKSLAAAGEESDDPRYRMLETVRQYAREQLLVAGEAPGLRDRHLAFFTRLAEEAEPRLQGAGQIEWLDRLERDQDNLRAALEWGLESCLPAAPRLAKCLIGYWVGRGLFIEGEQWLKKAVECLNHLPSEENQGEYIETEAQRQATQANLLAGAAWMTTNHGDARAGIQMGEEAERWGRASGDPRALSYALATKALGQSFFSEYAADGKAAIEEGLALARQVGDVWLQCMHLQIGTVVAGRGRRDIQAAASLQQEQSRLARQLGNPWMKAVSLFSRLFIDQEQGRILEARQDVEEAIRLFERMKNRTFITILRSELAHMLRREGDLDAAQDIYRETIPKWLELGSQSAVAHQFESLASIEISRGGLRRATRLLGAASGLRLRTGSEMIESERPEYEATLARLRASMDADILQLEWSAGETMDIEQAVAYALGDGLVF